MKNLIKLFLLIFLFMISLNVKSQSWKSVRQKWHYLNKTNDTIFCVIYEPKDSSYSETYFIKLNKTWKSFYPNGVLKEEGHFKKQYHGSRFFFEYLFNLGNYNYQIQNGVWKIYDKNGILVKTLIFNKGYVLDDNNNEIFYNYRSDIW